MAVLARVTPALKSSMRQDLRRRLDALQLEIRQLDLQLKRVGDETGGGKPGDSPVAAEIARGQQGRRHKIRELLEQERQVELLEPGSLIRQGTIQSEVEVSVGDSWDSLMDCAIVVEDGVVVEIRGRQDS